MKYHLIHVSKIKMDCQSFSLMLTFWIVGLLAGAHLCSLQSPFTSSFLILAISNRPSFLTYILSSAFPAVLSILVLYLLPEKCFCCFAFLFAFLSAYVFCGIMMAFPAASMLALAVFCFSRLLVLPFLVFLWLLYFRPADHRTRLIGLASSAFALMVLSVISYWWLLPFSITVFKS